MDTIGSSHSTRLLAASTLRTVLGTRNLAEILSERETISHTMQTSLDEATDPWGVKVERVEMWVSSGGKNRKTSFELEKLSTSKLCKYWRWGIREGNVIGRETNTHGAGWKRWTDLWTPVRFERINSGSRARVSNSINFSFCDTESRWSTLNWSTARIKETITSESRQLRKAGSRNFWNSTNIVSIVEAKRFHRGCRYDASIAAIFHLGFFRVSSMVQDTLSVARISSFPREMIFIASLYIKHSMLSRWSIALPVFHGESLYSADSVLRFRLWTCTRDSIEFTLPNFLRNVSDIFWL